MILFGRKTFIYSCIFLLHFVSSKNFPQSIKFGHFSVEEELSNGFVNCLIQDRNGFIWFGTDDGLNRFDGYEVKVYRNDPNDESSISENIIWALWEDRSGNLWVGTKSGGLNKYDHLTDKFQHWKLDSASEDEINITCIYEDNNNNIWIGTYKNGLFRFIPSENKFENWRNTLGGSKILSNNFVTSIFEDLNADIWIATFKGLNKFNHDSPGNPFIRVLPELEIPIWSLTNSSFYKDELWLGTFNGLIRFNPKTQSLINFSLPDSYGFEFGSSVSSVAEEEFLGEKILWIGTFGGLVRINLTTGLKERFIQTKKGDGEILSNQVQDMIIDKSGVIWIATENGINFYSRKNSKFNLQSSGKNFAALLPELSNKNLRAFAETNNKVLWFGTDAGLFACSPNFPKLHSYNKSELKSLNVWSFCNGGSNSLWIGTYGQGLKEFNLVTKSLKTWKVDNPLFNSTAFNYIKTIQEDNLGFIWVGFWGGGLARLDPSTGKVIHWRNEENNPSSLSYNDVSIIYEDKKERIWVGTNGGGLDLFQGENQNDFYIWSTSGKGKQQLSSNSIYTICESTRNSKPDNQTILWIGTANGLNKFMIKNDSGSSIGSKLEVEIKHYTVNNGLPDNAIECIIEDENGNLWIGTSSNISFFNVKEESFTNYSKADGLNGSTFNSSAVLRTSEGIMIFGCTNGLNYFNPDRIKKSDYSPPVVITEFKIFNQKTGNKNFSSLISSISNSEEIVLSHDQNDFSFQFASLDYNAPELNQYAYYMEGYDKSWIYSRKRRFVTYTNLDPGEYIFQVKATNSDGVWSRNVAKIFIVINPPFWRTWWAYTIYAIVFLGSMYLIRATELKRRQRKEEERLRREREAALLREAELKAKNIEQQKEIEKQKIRNRIAQDIHDEIGSNLSSISLMSELIQNDENINKEASDKLKRIHKVAKSSTQSIRDIVWLTNPASDTVKDLVARMREVAENISGKFNLNFDYPNDIPDINLSPETKRNLFYTFKESLNNIVKHAEAKNVDIKLQVENNSILLSVKDDGKGFNASGNFGGNGIKNIRSRANELNAELKFESEPGRGTFIELNVNITQMRD